jgi:hypothetical protein
MAYTSVTLSGYDASPPPDDGSTGPNNQVKWFTIKSKLFDPLRTGLETIDDHVSSAIVTADSTLATLQSGASTLATNAAAISTTLGAPQGTQMLFRQTTPPNGWTKGTDLDDYALRLVTGTASTGGSTAFSSVFAARTIATANLPSHTHSFSDSSSASFSGTTTFVYDVSDSTTSIEGGGGTTLLTEVTHNTDTITGTFAISGDTSSTGSGSTWDFAVQYVDLIYATKA